MGTSAHKGDVPVKVVCRGLQSSLPSPVGHGIRVGWVVTVGPTRRPRSGVQSGRGTHRNGLKNSLNLRQRGVTVTRKG